MDNSGDSTHRPQAIPPQRFRNQATGIGQTREASALTGARRSQQVIDAAPKAQERVADPSYPAPTAVYDPKTNLSRHKYTGVIVSPIALGKAGQ